MGEYCHCPGDCVGARVPRHTGFPLPPLWDLGGEQVLGSASVSRWQAKAYRGAPGPGSWKRQGWTWVLSLSKEGLLHLSGQGGLPGELSLEMPQSQGTVLSFLPFAAGLCPGLCFSRAHSCSLNSQWLWDGVSLTEGSSTPSPPALTLFLSSLEDCKGTEVGGGWAAEI